VVAQPETRLEMEEVIAHPETEEQMARQLETRIQMEEEVEEDEQAGGESEEELEALLGKQAT
jgi:hypothetical protein